MEYSSGFFLENLSAEMCIRDRNGTGKSTLGNTLLGNPKYNVTRGEIWFQGKNITEEPVNERAKMGLFLSFQNPLEVPGVTLSSFIRSAVELKTGKRMRLFEFRKELEKAMEVLQMEMCIRDRADAVRVPISPASDPAHCCDTIRSTHRRKG